MSHAHDNAASAGRRGRGRAVPGRRISDQDLQRLHHARAGPVEISDCRPPDTRGRSRTARRSLPPGAAGHPVHFLLGAREIEAARRDHDHVRVGGRAVPPRSSRANACRPRRTDSRRRPSRSARASSCPPPSAAPSTRCRPRAARVRRRGRGEFPHPRLQCRAPPPRRAPAMPSARGHAPEILPDLRQRIRLQRDDLRAAPSCRARWPASTSRRLTAQTSHWICVRMWVGSSRSSTSSKTS